MVLTGCASVPVEKRFEDFMTEVSERTGHVPEWSGVTTDETAVAEAVESMLAEELTAEEAVHIGLLYNRRLQATYADFGIALADLVQAGLPPNPVAEIIVRFQEESEFNLRAWEVIVVQDFLDVLLIPLRKKVARAEFEQAKLEVTREVIKHTTETRIAYYETQAAEQTLELMQTVLIAAEASFEMAWRLYSAGNTSTADLLAERARYEQTKLAVAEAEMLVADAREALNRSMGLWGNATLWGGVPRLPAIPAEELNLDTLEQRVIDSNLDLQIAWYDIEAIAKRNRIKSVTTVIPELNLGGEFERETEVETEIETNANGETELRSSEGPDLWWRGPSLSVPIPIFDQGQAARTKRELAVRQAWDRFTALAIEVRSLARKQGYELQYRRNRAQYYQEVMVPIQHRLRLQMQLRYNAMFIGVFRLLDAKRDEIGTAREYVSSLRDYWIARAQMEAMLMGKLPEGDDAMMGGGNASVGRNGAEGGH
jgi:cobalt-zinc-cadmium efflux system outer membrane protein